MLYRCHGLLFVFAIASGQVMSPHQSNVPKVKSIFEGAFLIYLSLLLSLSLSLSLSFSVVNDQGTRLPIELFWADE